MGRKRPITKKRAGTSDFGSENALQLFSGSSPDHQGREVVNLGECLSSPPHRTPPYQFELVFVRFHPPFRFSEDTQVQRGLVTCPRSHSKLEAKPGLTTTSLASESRPHSFSQKLGCLGAYSGDLESPRVRDDS